MKIVSVYNVFRLAPHGMGRLPDALVVRIVDGPIRVGDVIRQGDQTWHLWDVDLSQPPFEDGSTPMVINPLRSIKELPTVGPVAVDDNHLDVYRRELSLGGYIFRPTLDDWAPNFPGNLVGISIINHYHYENWFKVSVIGGDDFSMEWMTNTLEAARRMVLSLPVVITIDDLRSRGFMFG